MEEEAWQNALRAIAEPAIASQVTPGLVIVASSPESPPRFAAYGNKVGSKAPFDALKSDAIFDLASITKSACTSIIAMKMIDRGSLSLDDLAIETLPELQGYGGESIAVSSLLGHSSGLPAHRRFFERIADGDLCGTSSAKAALVAMAASTPIEYQAASKSVYSDLGYILLGTLLERVGGASLDALFENEIASPLGLKDTTFLPTQTTIPTSIKHRIVGTEVHAEEGLLYGRVHDDNCRAAGGVCGHAGLFGTAKDLLCIGTELLACFQGKSNFVATNTLREFWTRKACMQSSWKMGWDSPAVPPAISQSGTYWPASGVGHLGFTGTSWWLAPEQGRIAIILSNRVFYSWEKEPIRALRRALMNSIWQGWPAL